LRNSGLHFTIMNSHRATKAAPPSYTEAMGGVQASAPYVLGNPITTGPTIVTTLVPLGPRSTHMICPCCQYEISTATQSTPGLIAYISGAVIALLGCFWGCCLIPCCFDECMDVRHTCPNCRSYLGQYRRWDQRTKSVETSPQLMQTSHITSTRLSILPEPRILQL